jgi:hypothetical protein
MEELPVLACSLDAEGLREQAGRYAEIGRAVVRAERSATSLSVELSPGADRALVEEAVRIERRCCPFFAIGWDPGSRVLSISVAHEEHAPALEALARNLRN